MYLGVALNFWYPLMTLFTASRKSFSVTVFLRARMAYIPASVHTLLISAPERETHVRILKSSITQVTAETYDKEPYKMKQAEQQMDKHIEEIPSNQILLLQYQSITMKSIGYRWHHTLTIEKKFVPVEFGQSRAKSSNRISLSQFIVRVWILNICVLLSISGRPNSTLRSSRPGRRSAGSRVSGLKQRDKPHPNHKQACR